MVTILGILLPVVLFIVTLPLRGVLLAFEAKLKLDERAERHSSMSLEERVKDDAQAVKKKSKRVAKKAVRIATQVAIKSLRALIACLRWVAALLGAISSFAGVLMIVACLIIVGVFGTLIMSVDSDTLSGSSAIVQGGTTSGSTQVSSSWVSAIDTMGSWYFNNIHTYQGVVIKQAGQQRSRSWYTCPLLGNQKVADDCSAFVTAVLAYAGYIDYSSSSVWVSNSFCEGQSSYMGSTLSKNFNHYKPSDYGTTYTPKVGDIVAYPGHVEILGKIDSDGIVWAYSWGSVPKTMPINRYVTVDVYIKKMWSSNSSSVTDIWQLK